jgi:hypothetical protein
LKCLKEIEEQLFGREPFPLLETLLLISPYVKSSTESISGLLYNDTVSSDKHEVRVKLYDLFFDLTYIALQRTEL